tara:strand:- start:596 stop:1654 length:1059 start_codon:yes stop_codon:yes gene_type:complete
MLRNLVNEFRTHCIDQNLEINNNQIRVINNLEKYYHSNFKSFLNKIFNKSKLKQGFYLFGDVGVGKTMILNFFFDKIKQKKIKLHFNEFMLNFHDFVHKRLNENEESVINLFVKNLKSKFSLIYFDEFQVTNIVDAMILGKLFEQIFHQDIKIIVTSNTRIADLYKDGLQRDQFKPFIKTMLIKSLEHELVIDDDYRKSKQNLKQRYFFPINQETNFRINKFYRTITKNKNKSNKVINVKGRDFEIENLYEDIARFDFKKLCNQNLGSEDYLEIIKNCKFLVIENIPQFDNTNANQQQRFITLIDIIYDKKIPIAVTARQSLSEFQSSKLLENPFKRTISRLYELTSVDINL